LADRFVRWAGKLEHTIAVAVESSNRLSGATLGRWPLRFLITGRAGVGTEVVFLAANPDTSVDCRNFGVTRGIIWSLLNTDPPVEVKPVNRDSTIS
jgi:hypothetical protein